MSAVRGQGLPPARRPLFVRFLMQMVWPAFLFAAATSGLVFSIVDPDSVEFITDNFEDTRASAYTLGFLVFWALYTLACSLTAFFVYSDLDARCRACLREAGGQYKPVPPLPDDD